MARVFISYSRTDKAFAQRLASDMARLGADVWIDMEDIPAGKDWSNAIQEGLDTGDVMLLLLSPKACASPNVEEEWKYFKEQGKPIIPILLEPCKIHYQLRSLQYIDFHTQDYDPALAQLQSALKRDGIELTSISASGARPSKVWAKIPRAYWAVGAGMVLVLIGVVAVLWNSLGGDNEDKTPPAPTRTPAATPQEETINGIPFVYVTGGCFEMGREDRASDEKPTHQVCLTDFWIGKTEVSNAQYRACVEAGVCTLPKDTTFYDEPDYDEYPVVSVDWEQAATYAEWVGGTLPTEAQWEYAARGSEGRTYPWGEAAPNCDLANIWVGTAACVGSAKPVGSYPDGVSWAGALDLIGNVWEWTADWYGAEYYATLDEKADNPSGPASGEARVMRGCMFNNPTTLLRATYRSKLAPDKVRSYLGFRVVRAP
ncbi:MAG TPA: SUMF1/EgtB/PvdO family nonheme iron enzyme [Aggregatilineaceae bacterium]|nr:SUMF1/EgtB/PvdO family nonheme iron enzyme [Aggregatilineaceae bacterium]